jgi:hypothetical protein
MPRNAAFTALAALALTLTSVTIAQPPEGHVVDDAFTFYTLENNQKSVNGKPKDEGWSLVADFRVFGETSQRSAFRFVVKKGQKKLGETTCEVATEDQFRKMAEGPASFYVIGCRDRNQRIQATGDLTVEVYFIDDATDRATKLRTHTIAVGSAGRVRGNGQPDAPHHYVDRSGETLGSVLHLQHNRSTHYWGQLHRQLGPVQGLNQVTLAINAAPDEDHRSIDPLTHLRCKVNGERIEMPHDQVVGREARSVYVVATWGKGQRDQRDPVQYRQFVLTLPLSFGSSVAEQTHDRYFPLEEKNPRYAYLDDHPGEWECEWRKDRDVLRVFRFVVGEDGKLVPHAEQAAGLTLGPNAFFVETEIPRGGSGYDTRVDGAAVSKRAFHGRGLASGEARALAKKLPKVGSTTPRRR